MCGGSCPNANDCTCEPDFDCDTFVVTLHSVLNGDQSHSSARQGHGLTPEPLHLQRGLLDHWQLAGPRHLGGVLARCQLISIWRVLAVAVAVSFAKGIWQRHIPHFCIVLSFM